MRSAAIIDLVSEAYVADEIGQQIAVETRRRVFANEFSVSSSEFYAGAAIGLKPGKRYQVRAIDYEGERTLEVDGVSYTVLRADTRGEWVSIICERKGADRG